LKWKEHLGYLKNPIEINEQTLNAPTFFPWSTLKLEYPHLAGVGSYGTGNHAAEKE